MYKRQGFVYDACGVTDIKRLYVVADVLITDYSSVFFDYANLHRPMLFYMYDQMCIRDRLIAVDAVGKKKSDAHGLPHRRLVKHIGQLLSLIHI